MLAPQIARTQNALLIAPLTHMASQILLIAVQNCRKNLDFDIADFSRVPGKKKKKRLRGVLSETHDQPSEHLPALFLQHSSQDFPKLSADTLRRTHPSPLTYHRCLEQLREVNWNFLSGRESCGDLFLFLDVFCVRICWHGVVAGCRPRWKHGSLVSGPLLQYETVWVPFWLQF